MPRQTSHTLQAAPQKAAPQKAKERDPVASGARDASVNRAASHNYFLLEKYEAGIALRGTEVKSIREGKANLKDAYGLVRNGEAFLLNAHIGPYSHGHARNHEGLRTFLMGFYPCRGNDERPRQLQSTQVARNRKPN